MLEHDSDSREELKRADHLLYVTLKYTKNIDVLKNAIRRLVNACDYGILDVMEYLKEKKKIKDIPLMPITRAEEVKKYLKKPELVEFIDFYLMLKKVDRAEFTKREEFKKNVRLVIVDENDETFEINIEKLYEKISGMVKTDIGLETIIPASSFVLNSKDYQIKQIVLSEDNVLKSSKNSRGQYRSQDNIRGHFHQPGRVFGKALLFFE